MTWSNKQWKTWNLTSKDSWTPDSKAKAKKAKEDYSAAIEAKIAGYGASSSQAKPSAPLGPEAIASKKAAAATIKQCLALKVTITNQATLMALDEEIKAARLIANNGVPSPNDIREAANFAAQAEIKHEKAAAHLKVAKECEARAKLEWDSAMVELRRVRSTSAKSPPPDSLQTMATLFNSLSTGATYTPDGRAVVDPAILRNLCNQLQSMAAPEHDANLPVVEEIEESEDAVFTDPYNTDMDWVPAADPSLESLSDLDAPALRIRLRQALQRPPQFKRIPGNQHGPSRIVPLRRQRRKVDALGTFKDQEALAASSRRDLMQDLQTPVPTNQNGDDEL